MMYEQGIGMAIFTSKTSRKNWCPTRL